MKKFKINKIILNVHLKILPKSVMHVAIKCCKHPAIYISKAMLTMPKGELLNDEGEKDKDKKLRCVPNLNRKIMQMHARNARLKMSRSSSTS